MADQSPPTAGKRFSEDLRRIREERDISVAEIQEETQIAETLITSFEEGRLYDHPTYNRVYLRSFIRAYADALNISRSDALEGLDAALDGTYDDALASKYLGGRSSTGRPTGSDAGETPDGASDDSAGASIDVQDAPTAGGPEGRGGIVGPPRAVGESPEDAPLGEPEPPTSGAERDEPEQDPSEPDEPHSSPPAAEDPEPETTGGPDPSAPPGPSAPPDESASDPAPPSDADEPPADEPSADEQQGDGAAGASDTPDWMAAPDDEDEADVSRPEPSTASPAEAPADEPVGTDDLGVVGEPSELGSSAAGEEGPGGPTGPSASGRSRSGSGGWGDDLLGEGRSLYVTGFGIAVVLLVLVGLGIAYFSTGGGDPTANAAPGADSTRASAPADTSAQTSRPPPADVSVGSTVDLMILADTNVGGLRVQRDDDLRRPYWIEEGEADLFPFQETVTIENGLSDVRLFIEGYPYPVDPGDTTDVLQITRAQAEAFVDTLRGAPPNLSVSPDTIPVGTSNQ